MRGRSKTSVTLQNSGESDTRKVTASHPVFVEGGEMGALMRSFDWSNNSLGPLIDTRGGHVSLVSNIEKHHSGTTVTIFIPFALPAST